MMSSDILALKLWTLCKSLQPNDNGAYCEHDDWSSQPGNLSIGWNPG